MLSSFRRAGSGLGRYGVNASRMEFVTRHEDSARRAVAQRVFFRCLKHQPKSDCLEIQLSKSGNLFDCAEVNKKLLGVALALGRRRSRSL